MDEILEFDNKNDNSIKYDIYDEDDKLEEELYTKYIETVEDLYKDQFKPFNL